MDISYHSGSVYAPSQPPAKRHSLSSAPSTRQEQRPYTSHKANVQNHSAPVPPHLPSLAPQNYVNAGAGSTASRSSVSRALQVSSIQTTHEGSYLYMPHGLPQFNHADTSLIQSQQSFTASHLQRPSPTVHDFPPSHAYAPQNSNAVPYLPYSPPIAAPARFPDIRPMPAGGLNEAPALPGSQKPASSASLALQNGQETQPTHVVGSQGRRGILPSADGRPTAVPTGTANGQKVGNVPLKDEDGKFPCPHCAKTYLHAKHLKRHLLRHTGTRPYSCGLCRDTFSRSDILKRHFQKCSVRRGNPTGENHLSHSRATKKSNLEKAAEASAMATSLPDRTRTIPSTQSTAVTDFAMTNIHTALDFSGLGLGSPGFADDPQSRPNRESRSNSIKQPSIGGLAGNSGNFSASSSSSFDHTGLSYSGGQVTPDSITTSGAATPYQYPNETRPNHFASDATFSHAPQGSGAHLTGSNSRTPSGLHYTNGSLPEIVGSTYNRMSDIDWNSLMAANGGEDYSNPQFHSTFHSSQQPIKSEQDLSHVSFPSPQGYPPFSQPKV